MKTLKLILPIIFLALFFSSCSTKLGTTTTQVDGYIYDSETMEPLVNAKLVIHNRYRQSGGWFAPGNIGTQVAEIFTNEDGYFTWETDEEPQFDDNDRQLNYNIHNVSLDDYISLLSSNAGSSFLHGSETTKEFFMIKLE